MFPKKFIGGKRSNHVKTVRELDPPPPTLGEVAPTCTEKHRNDPAPSVERAQNLDPDLVKLEERWPSLPEKIRASIIALIEVRWELY
jgi:hypothetical protein